jgi:tetratricopeptide (TPR) repeat protein
MPGSGRGKRRLRAVLIGAAVLALMACGIGWWSARSRAITEPASRAAEAYRRGEWTTAAKLARQTLAKRKDDPAALRLLARASARLGRDTAALAIYERSFDEKKLEAEDHLLLGLVHQRQGRVDAAVRDWKQAVEAQRASPEFLEELGRVLIQGRRWDDAIAVTDRLSKEPGWEARGSMMLGTIRVDLNNRPGAAQSFRRALELDPAEVEKSSNPKRLRKLIARTFLRTAHPAEAAAVLQPMVERGLDSETAWLMSRIYLQEGDKTRALTALKQAGSYRASNPLDVDPGPYVGEAQCEKCHAAIYRDSLSNRHTQTYYRGTQLDAIPLPDRPLPDPDDPKVIHTFQRREGALHEFTGVGREVFDAVVEYAFGTSDRYLTTVSRDAKGGYHIARLSYYQTPDGKGWDRSTLDPTHPTHAQPDGFLGRSIDVRDGLAKCLYCHVTNPRTGHDAMGPEMADRAIGCERCHGPGGNHIAALALGFPDSAIVNPAGDSPETVTIKQCNDCHILAKDFRNDDPENPGWIRSAGVGWTHSRCNTESGGTFGCVTCHNPHQRASATSATDYEARCIKCHAPASKTGENEQPAPTAQTGVAPTFRACPVNPSRGCLECHMPRVRIDSIHGNLTDHYIRVHRQK